MHAEPLILCSFPIVMDLQSKKMVFDLNAFYSKVTEALNCASWELAFTHSNVRVKCVSIFYDRIHILNLRNILKLACSHTTHKWQNSVWEIKSLILFQLETMHPIFWGMFLENQFPLPEDMLFVLDLRRALVLTDTFEQLAAAHHSVYKRPLMVNM